MLFDGKSDHLLKCPPHRKILPKLSIFDQKLKFTLLTFYPFQQTWKKEVWEYNKRIKGEESSLPLDHEVLIKRRKQELRHAQDIKELYERKLERVNDLFVELNAWKLQLEEEKRNLVKREKQLSIKGSKVTPKFSLKPQCCCFLLCPALFFL